MVDSARRFVYVSKMVGINSKNRSANIKLKAFTYNIHQKSLM